MCFTINMVEFLNRRFCWFIYIGGIQMRDCKIWLGLPRNYNGDGTYPCTASSQILQDAIKKEMRSAPNIAVLNRRYSIMNTNLWLMFDHEELRGATYSRLKILLHDEFEDRWETLLDESD